MKLKAIRDINSGTFPPGTEFELDLDPESLAQLLASGAAILVARPAEDDRPAAVKKGAKS